MVDKQITDWVFVDHIGTNDAVYRCKCGIEKIFNYKRFLKYPSKCCRSCSSKNQKNRKSYHNDSTKRSEYYLLYSAWKGMKKRCYCVKGKKYHRYGGRGITVCELWKNSYVEFKKWSIENGWNENLSIDRINNDGNYCPENCRWITLRMNSLLGNEYNRNAKSGAWSEKFKINAKEIHTELSGKKCKLFIDKEWKFFDSISLLSEHLSVVLNKPFVNVYSNVKQSLSKGKNKAYSYKVEIML